MPYITDKERDQVHNWDKGAGFDPQTPGQLNYTFSVLIDNYLRDELSYTSINTVIGVLECAKLELYRRIAAPYEDKKKNENGDVYTVS